MIEKDESPDKAHRPRLLIIGLNPAWQKTLLFHGFYYGGINRADAMEELAAGKGVNVARAAKTAGASATVAQFAGGDTGRRLTRAEDEEGMGHITVEISGATRTCTTILDSAREMMTELIEPSPSVSNAETEHLREKIGRRAEHCDGIAISGTYPPGIPDDFYAGIIASLKKKRPVIVDAFKGVSSALNEQPDVLKINAHELDCLTRCGPDLLTGLTQINNSYDIPVVAVTAGESTAFCCVGKRHFAFTLPRLDRVVSPLGAGDVVTAVFLVGLCTAVKERRLPWPLTGDAINLQQATLLAELFAEALAAATASCLNTRPATYDPATAMRMKSEITWRQLE